MHYKNTRDYWSHLENREDYQTIETRLLDKMQTIKDLHDQANSDSLMQFLSSHRTMKTYLPDQMLSSACGITALATDKPVYFIGDIHSDDEALDRIIEMTNPYHSDVMLIFLGDYVDRGISHLATLDKLWALKIDLPYQVVLLRGNHDSGYFEDGEVKLEYRQDPKSKPTDFFPLYLDDLRKKGKLSEAFMASYFDFSHQLNHVALVKRLDKWVMGVHAGIPRPRGEANFYDYINVLSDFNNPNIIDHIDRSIIKNMLWSDPREGEGDVIDKGRFSTYEKHFDTFSERFGIAMMIRGHVAEKTGHKSIYQNRVHTIFSSGGTSKTTAYGYVKTPKIMKMYENTSYEILEMY